MVRLLFELTDAECVQFGPNSGFRETVDEVRWRLSRAPLSQRWSRLLSQCHVRLARLRMAAQSSAAESRLGSPNSIHHTLARELHMAIWLLLQVYLSTEIVYQKAPIRGSAIGPCE